jgi:NhaA family Na+:H+ antiporter
MESETDRPFKDRRHNAPIERYLHPIDSLIKEVVRHKVSSGIVLFLATALALIIANSPLADLYYEFINLKIGFKIGDWELRESLKHWVSDGLMAVFFLYIGLEIKRELFLKEYSMLRDTMLPIAGAFGGIIVPALIYFYINQEQPEVRGWSIPVATDIAFAIGVLALLGDKVPRALYMFLITLAIVDDLVAVLIIAFIYSEEIVWAYLFRAFLIFAFLILLNIIGVRRSLPYFIVGLFLWFAMLKSGVHATIAGVLMAFAFPSSSKANPKFFSNQVESITQMFRRYQQESIVKDGKDLQDDLEQHTVVRGFRDGLNLVESPLHRIMDELRIPVLFVIMPIFAFVNAGIPLGPSFLSEPFTQPVTMGIFLGLLLGKCIGIFSASMIAVKIGLAKLPEGINKKHLFCVSIIGGIGFTMSMFIADLAFRESAETLRLAIIGVFYGSIVSGSIGYFLLNSLLKTGSHEQHTTS